MKTLQFIGVLLYATNIVASQDAVHQATKAKKWASVQKIYRILCRSTPQQTDPSVIATIPAIVTRMQYPSKRIQQLSQNN